MDTKVANHPDLVTGPFSGDTMLPDAEELVRQCGKMELLERLLKKLHAGGHKVWEALGFLLTHVPWLELLINGTAWELRAGVQRSGPMYHPPAPPRS